jgi:hypothetical protein
MQIQIFKLEDKELYEKYLIAVQDVNKNEQLEKSIPGLVVVKNLRNVRVVNF